MSSNIFMRCARYFRFTSDTPIGNDLLFVIAIENPNFIRIKLARSLRLVPFAIYPVVKLRTNIILKELHLYNFVILISDVCCNCVV